MNSSFKKLIALFAVFCLVLSCVPVSGGTVQAQAAEEYTYYFWGDHNPETYTELLNVSDHTQDHGFVQVMCSNGCFRIYDDTITEIAIHANTGGENGHGTPSNYVVSPGAIVYNIGETIHSIYGNEYKEYAIAVTTKKSSVKVYYFPDEGYDAGICSPEINVNGKDWIHYSGSQGDYTFDYAPFINSDGTKGDHADCSVAFFKQKLYVNFPFASIKGPWSESDGKLYFYNEAMGFVIIDGSIRDSLYVVPDPSLKKNYWDNDGFNVEVERNEDAIKNAFKLGPGFENNDYNTFVLFYDVPTGENDEWGHEIMERHDVALFHENGKVKIWEPIETWPEEVETDLTTPEILCQSWSRTMVNFGCSEIPPVVAKDGSSISFYNDKDKAMKITVTATDNTKISAYTYDYWVDGNNEKQYYIDIWFNGRNFTLTFECAAGYTFESGYRYIVDNDYSDKPNVAEYSANGTYPVTLKDPINDNEFFFMWMKVEKKQPASTSVPSYSDYSYTAPADTTTTTTDGTGSTTAGTTTTENADGTKTTTTENADGSKTSTTEGTDGTKTTTTEGTDGTKTTTTESTDGTKTTTTESKDGSKSTTTENKDGSKVTTTESADGTKSTTTETTDGTKTTLTENKDGSTTTKTENKDGSSNSTTVKENSDGTKTTQTEDKKADGTVTATTKTEKKDGTTETKTEKTGKNGTKEVETKTEDKNGNSKTETQQLDASGKVVSKTEETVSKDYKGTETVETKVENADGSSLASTVTTSTAGKVVAEVVEIASNGKLSITLETDKPNGDEVVKEFTSAKDDGIKLTDYDTKGKTAVIPAFVKGFAVTTIGKGALKNSSIKKITLPDTITTIGKGAFQNAKDLKTIVLSSGITQISPKAFAGIAKNAQFKINAATKEEFERIVNLIKASGVDKSVKFKQID
ncbi:MAG: leucine-rich repeat domain-containing protein [Lachnospiraceae bacterium]|nr:leucine-rich repeat domain-containing protein [Lachnospiraceae bacterium]